MSYLKLCRGLIRKHYLTQLRTYAVTHDTSIIGMLNMHSAPIQVDRGLYSMYTSLASPIFCRYAGSSVLHLHLDKEHSRFTISEFHWLVYKKEILEDSEYLLPEETPDCKSMINTFLKYAAICCKEQSMDTDDFLIPDDTNF